MKIPNSKMDPMLVDPGKLLVSFILDLHKEEIPLEEVEIIVFSMVKQLAKAAAPDDRPKDLLKFCDELNIFVKSITSQLKDAEENS